MADLAIGVGHDLLLASLTEFSEWFDVVPEQRVRPFPATKVVHLDKSIKFIGEEIIELFIGGCTQVQLNSYVTAIFGNYNTHSVDATIYARNMNGNMALFNVKAHIPSVNEDLRFIWHDEAEGLRLTFIVDD